jgi:hypothetical protein
MLTVRQPPHLIELIYGRFLFEHRGSPAEYGAGLKLAIERGWRWLHESGTYHRVQICSHDLLERCTGPLGPTPSSHFHQVSRPFAGTRPAILAMILEFRTYHHRSGN